MSNTKQPKIYLRGPLAGITRKSGTCLDGLVWIQFEVDAFAGQDPGTCSVCGAEGLEAGWTCLYGGEEACEGCVEVLPEWQAEETGDLDLLVSMMAPSPEAAEEVRGRVQSIAGSRLEVTDQLVMAIVPRDRLDEVVEGLEGYGLVGPNGEQLLVPARD